jgi:hypothetical protein
MRRRGFASAQLAGEVGALLGVESIGSGAGRRLARPRETKSHTNTGDQLCIVRFVYRAFAPSCSEECTVIQPDWYQNPPRIESPYGRSAPESSSHPAFSDVTRSRSRYFPATLPEVIARAGAGSAPSR